MTLVGTLNFVACCIPHGRVFLSRLRKAAYHHPRTLTDGAREDLQFWRQSLLHCNGIASFAGSFGDMPILHFSSDAAFLGFGCLCVERQQYIGGTWTEDELLEFGIVHFEAAAIGFGASVWGPHMAGGILVCHSDNTACVSMFETGRAFDERLICILRAVVLVQLQHKFLLRVRHLPGVLNGGSDGISRQRGLHPRFSCFVQQHLSPEQRSIGGVMLTGSAPPLLLEGPSLLQQLTLISTHENSGMIPPTHMPWMIWNVPPPPAAPSDVMDAFSTSPLGSLSG
jgi:hypothetical protein